MQLDTILARLRTLLPELVESENFILARSVREVIAMIEAELGEAETHDLNAA